jgi:hypothetical protein
MKKVVIFGLVAGALMLAVSIVLSLIISTIFPQAMAEYSNSQIFRQMDDPLMYYFFLRLALLRCTRNADVHQLRPGLDVSGGDLDGHRPGLGPRGRGRHQSDGQIVETESKNVQNSFFEMR